jgi:gliding motility-associated-like protein
MRKFVLSLFCITICHFVFAQDFSNKGKDFWLTFPAHADVASAVMGIYITSDEAATGTVTAGGTTIPFTIAPNTVKTIFLGPNADNDAPNTAIYLSGDDIIKNGAGVHVTSDKPIVVYGHIIRDARSGASLILPTNVWGKEYIVPNYSSVGTAGGPLGGRGVITVLAKEANTVVEIVPNTKNVANTKTAGTAYTITLANPGDVYQVQYEKDADISGTTVRSIATATVKCKPIAVFSSSTWSAFGCGGSPTGGDNLYQQLFPTQSFGKSFLTAPFLNRQQDIIRIFVTDPLTVVTLISGGITTTLGGLQKNSFYEFITGQPTKIDANKPISVVQYITSQSCNPGFLADPEMIILNPVEQTINNITVFSAHKNFVPKGQSVVDQCYLNIIIKTVAAPSFKINGAAPTATFKPIPGTDFSYLQENVSTLSATNPLQRLTADSNFSAIAYGYGDVESYGYNAGTYIKDLHQYVGIKNERATLNYPATCKDAPFKFSVTLPYQAKSIEWDFKGKFPNQTVNNPVPDSTFVIDGKTLNRYTLPNTYIYNAVGSFPISINAFNQSADGCDGEQQLDYDVEVLEKPVAKFTTQFTGCLEDSVRFIDASTGNNINHWEWNFGDAKTSLLKNAGTKYTVAGTYNVTETVVTNIGCLADTTVKLEITTKPTASFTVAAPYCSGSTLSFVDASTNATGAITRRYWDFGNGRKDTLTTNAAPAVVYSTAGKYIITLIVESSSGCRSAAFSKEIDVTVGAIANFDKPTAVCMPAGLAKFTNKTTIADGTLSQLKYTWDFGDGGTSTATDPEHTYKSLGSYIVKLTVTSGGGCISEFSDVFDAIYPQPTAGFTITAGACLGDSTRFTDNTTGANQTMVNFGWTFGDNQSSTLKDAANKYAMPSTFTVKHWAVSDKGCVSDTTTQPITINPPPVAAFTHTSLCENQPVTFTNQSTTVAGTIARWQWDLGDGTIKDETNGNGFEHSYTNAGDKTVKLLVTTDKGCKSDTTSKTLQVNISPIVNFGLPQICLNDPFAQFTDSSTIADGSAAQFKWLWNFGDANATAANPNTSSVKNPRHAFITAGNYTISLAVTSGNGCTSSTSKTLTVSSAPTADFNLTKPSGFCSNEIVGITDNSSIATGTISKTEIYWEWPSTTIKTVDENPNLGKVYDHQYASFQTPATRTYSIRYLVYSGGICVNETTKSVTLYASPQITFPSIAGICIDATPRLITASANMPGAGVFSGTGISNNGLFTPTVAGEGTFDIKYVYTLPQGCADSVTQTISVWPKPIADFTVTNACENAPVTFTDASVAGAGKINSRSWTYGDGTIENRTNGNVFSKTFTGATTTSAQLLVATDSGCTSLPVMKTITLNQIPVAKFDLPSVVCLPSGAAQFTNRSTIADGSENQLTYLWNFGAPGATATQKDGFYNFPVVGNYAIKLKVTSKDGCADSSTQTLSNITPQPMANFDLAPTEICLGGVINFTDKSNPLSETITGWHWDFKDGTTAQAKDTVHRYTTAGTYDVSLYYTTGKGCHSDTVTKRVIIHPIPVVNAGGEVYVIVGGQKTIPAQVSGSSNYEYGWSPSTWLSNPNVLNPVTNATADITYRLTVTGEGGCSAWDEVKVRYVLAPIVPNAFSPNGDGINDVWDIKYLTGYEGATVQVFDRYGRQVFTSTGYNTPWDGKLNGTILPTGVYYYIIDPKNNKQKITGSLTLLR